LFFLSLSILRGFVVGSLPPEMPFALSVECIGRFALSFSVFSAADLGGLVYKVRFSERPRRFCPWFRYDPVLRGRPNEKRV
jgi:hypothetical protein